MSALKKPLPVSGFDVDRLGTLLAQAAPLVKEIEKIKDRIKDQVAVKLEGNLFDATVVRSTELRVNRDLVEKVVGAENMFKVLKEGEKVSVRVVSKSVS